MSDYVSASQLEKTERCMFEYYLRYVITDITLDQKIEEAHPENTKVFCADTELLLGWIWSATDAGTSQVNIAPVKRFNKINPGTKVVLGGSTKSYTITKTRRPVSPSSPAMDFGKLCHAFFYEATRKAMELWDAIGTRTLTNIKDTVATYEKWGEETVLKVIKDRCLITMGRDGEQETTSGMVLNQPGFEEDWKYIARGFYRFNNFQNSKPGNLFYEERIMVDSDMQEVTNIDDAFLLGFVDKYEIIVDPNNGEKVIELVDYKTNRVPESTAILNNKPQLNIYALALLERHPEVTKVIKKYHFVRMGKTGLVTAGEIVRGSYTHTRRKEELDNAVARLEDERDFHPAINEYCGDCSLVTVCPKYQKALDQTKNKIAITSVEEAKQISESIIMLEAALKKQRKQIKSWIEQNSEVEVTSNVIAHVSVSESIGVPGSAGIAFIQENNGDLDAINVTSTQLNKAFKITHPDKREREQLIGSLQAVSGKPTFRGTLKIGKKSK